MVWLSSANYYSNYEQKKNINQFIIDGDTQFYLNAQALIRNSACFTETYHIANESEALVYLVENRNKPELIPNYIFLDVSIPLMGTWTFLDAFESLYPKLKKM
jgi:hypothetical protein